MGGYAPAPADDAPKTREEADQRNAIRNANRQRVGLDYWEVDTRTEQSTPVPQQQQTIRVRDAQDYQSGQAAWTPIVIGANNQRYSLRTGQRINPNDTYRASELPSKYAVESRAGYTDPSTLGDSTTQRLLQQRSTANMTSEQRYALLGTVLESQRQEAYKTATLTDDRFFENEIQKWGQNYVERGSAQHFYLKDTNQVGTNEYEYQADLAVEFLKGSPKKSSEWFSPASGQMAGYLPGGKGLQEYSWDRAVAYDRGLPAPGQVSFMSGIERVGSARGSLFTPSFDRSAKGTPMATSVSAFGSTETPSWMPAGVGTTGAFGKVESGDAPFLGTSRLIDKPGAVALSTNLALMGRNYAETRDIGGLYRDFTQSVAINTLHAWMPSAKGFGDFVDRQQAVSPNPVGTVVAGTAHFGEAMYTDVREDPVQDLLLVGLPRAFKFAEVGTTNLIARGATSSSKVWNFGGRALSTPTAKTSAAIFKTGLAGAYVFQSGMSVYDAPNTSKGKGTALGHVGYQVGMMGLGLPLAAQYTPKIRANPSDSRTFFTGERKLPMSERAMIRAGDFVTGLSKNKGQRIAIKAVSTEYQKNAFTKPEITTVEPNLADLTHVGPKNAASVKAAMTSQTSVGYGSGMMDAQVGKTPAGAVLRKTALPSSDADVFAEFPELMEAKAGKASVGMDIHAFPEGYVDVGQATNQPIEIGSYLFGNRYRSNPYIDEITMPGKTAGYKGKISFEHLNVQYRKLSSAVRDDVSDPMNKGYRLGKDLSRLTRVRDVLQEVKTGNTKGSAFDEMLKQQITYNAQTSSGGKPRILTETLGEVRARYEGNPKQVTPNMFSQYSRGAISSTVSSLAPGSSMFIGSLGRSSISPRPSSSGISYRPSSIGSSVASRIPYSPSTGSPGSPSPRTPSFPGSSISTPPRSPPSRTPGSPPSSPPSSPPYTPPSVPPRSPPSSPPRSPPSSPPSTPPYTPPVTPPSVPPVGFPGMPGGGGGGSPFGMRVSAPWSRKNLTGAELFMKGKKNRKGRFPF